MKAAEAAEQSIRRDLVIRVKTVLKRKAKQMMAVNLALKRFLCMWSWKKQKARCGQWLSHCNKQQRPLPYRPTSEITTAKMRWKKTAM